MNRQDAKSAKEYQKILATLASSTTWSDFQGGLNDFTAKPQRGQGVASEARSRRRIAGSVAGR
jgi:hypothetical protein